VLCRGYAVVTDPASGRVLMTGRAARETRDIRVTFQDGSIEALVKETSDGEKN